MNISEKTFICQFIYYSLFKRRLFDDKEMINYIDTKLGQGADGVKIILQDNPELYETIKMKVLKAIKEQ